MKNDCESVAVYPYGIEFAPIMRHIGLLKNYKVTELISARGCLLEGEDCSSIDRGEKIGIAVKNDYESSIINCDTIIINDYITDEKYKEIVYSNMEKAINLRKNVICTMPLIEEDFIELLEKKALQKGVYFKKYNKKSNETLIDIEKEYLDVIEVPVVFVAGMEENTGKFETQLSLREGLLNKGYKVSQIGTRHYCELLGFHSFPKFMFNDNISNFKKIIKFNDYVKKIEKNEQPDIFIIGIPGEIMPLNKVFLGNFGYIAYLVSQAIKSDYTIVNTFILESETKINNLVRLFSSRLGCQVDCVNVSNAQLDLSFSYESKKISLNYLPSSFVEQKIKRYKQYSNVPLFNSKNPVDKKKMVDKMIEILSGYNELEEVSMGGL